MGRRSRALQLPAALARCCRARPAPPPAGLMGNVVQAEGGCGAILCEAGAGGGCEDCSL